MSLTTFLIMMFAAALHATWNAIVKGGSDKLMTTALVTGAGALLSALFLPFLPAPAPESWPFIAASSVMQIVYYVLVAQTYRLADMSLTYPLMRGTAPLIVAAVSILLGTEHLAPMAWIGVLIICTGVLSMALGRHPSDQRTGLLLALLNATVIASYTLVDGAGVRRSDAPAAYTLWIFLLTGVPMILWGLVVRKDWFVAYARAQWHVGLIGGFGTVTSYGLALWAMTLAPVAVIAALRETSILFGTLISLFILREQVGKRRIIAAVCIAIGAIALRLS
ncbi:EamA family transporter [Celeribacter litoreus]|uniref:EamA family transporter n=1 Tax=Celeribacter litoreus TaxID=2876714 RepID=UPI001CCED2E7|nr:EamA family transporter [Celeribacter litoreus]MCA0044644.1 DMT family transporter [Celeribacter litoreus]